MWTRQGLNLRPSRYERAATTSELQVLKIEFSHPCLEVFHPNTYDECLSVCHRSLFRGAG